MPSRLITISVRTADVIRMYGGESFQNLKPNGDGFLITAYLTDSIKVGEPVWTRSK